ncbi:glucose-6-phosphate isomerase [Candidatus Fermentibacteria bacterium]|nr:MAG: glucose-6-phosphate isomerase [Candidatus Fermentibacteria bacterium]
MSAQLFDFKPGFNWDSIQSETLELFDLWRKQGRLGFLDLPYNLTLHRDTADLAEMYRRKYDTLFVAGIGGSSLGLRAILSALDDQSGGKVVVVDSPDSRVIKNAVSETAPGNSVIAVVTKSGGTAETLSIFMELRRKLGDDAPVVAITDPVNSQLRELAEKRGWNTLPVPANVGGRFSVLSPVGLFPAAFAGIDTAELIKGAVDVVEDFDANGVRSLAAVVAGAFLSKFKSHPVHVFMPYSDFLYDTALWFAQLWAESLGKRLDMNGNTVATGQTPLACRGPADQHSLVQLFMEGPADKTVTIVTEGEPEDAEPLSGEFADQPAMNYLEGRSPDVLRKAEADATATALSERGLPVSRIHIPDINASYTGQIFMTLEIATVLTGLALGVDPLNQPGVERGKILTYKAMGREGY